MGLKNKAGQGNLNSTPAKGENGFMARKEYLLKQKHLGRRLLGVFPAQYPKEILWAMNLLPVEIWDPPLESSNANAHLQPYICSVVKQGLELILQGKADMLEGFLFPHTCDSIQNLASIINDYLNLEKPCFFFYHPKAPYHACSRDYYLDQMRLLITSLEKDFGPMDPAALGQSVEQGRRLSGIIREIYDLRSKGELSASNVRFYEVIRQGEYLHPDDFIPLLEEFVHTHKGKAQKGMPVLLSGVLPNPPEILEILDGIGARVVNDDFLSCGRRLLVPSSPEKEPLDALADSYFAMPPCTTKNTPLKERVDYLLEMAKTSGAKGVIFYMVKFCEPELFDVPRVVKALKAAEIATLVIDVELNQGVSGQMSTRVEAFLEMIS